jgi:hypothetical protein
MNMLMGSWVAQAVGAAARLGFADAMRNGPADTQAIAAHAGSDPECTARLLRALATVGVFASTGPDRWALTPVGECLVTGTGGSMRDFAIAETDTAHWLTWNRFTEAVRTGQPQAELALQCAPWDYYAKHPEDGEVFSRAMAGLSRIAIGPVLGTYDFSGHGVIADVGGAHGALLAAVLQANPSARGILFDLPQVVAGATALLDEAGVGARVERVGGNFLEGAVPQADLYLLKHVLHDWNDDASVAILRNVRASMKPSSRVLVIELVVPEPPQPGPAMLMDLNMMVMLGGKERTAAQYGALLQRAGLEPLRVMPTPSPVGLVEAGPG